jgi:hypothetical protein
MKTFVSAAIVALSLLAPAASAAAYDAHFGNYPQWAQKFLDDGCVIQPVPQAGP